MIPKVIQKGKKLESKEIVSFKKKNDTIVLFTNRVNRTINLKPILNIKYDSMGLSWFCKNNISTDYYFIRDQLHHLSFKNSKKQESINDFIRLINKEQFEKTIKIIVNINENNYKKYHEYLNWNRYSPKIIGKKLFLKEGTSLKINDFRNINPFLNLSVGSSLFSPILHLLIYYKYKTIIFSENIFNNLILMQNESKEFIRYLLKTTKRKYKVKYFYIDENRLKLFI